MRLRPTAASLLWVSVAWAAEKPSLQKFPEAIAHKDGFLQDRALYDRRMSELLFDKTEAFQDAANRSGKPFVMHVGIDKTLIDGLELVELRFEDSNRQSRVFSTSELSRSRLRWLSFRFEKLPLGTKLFQVRLKYRVNGGPSYDRWGVGTLVDAEATTTDSTPEAFFDLNHFRDLTQVAVTQIDIDKPFAEAPPTGQSVPDRGPEFFFFRPKRGLPKLADTRAPIIAPTGSAAAANAPAKASKFFDPLKALIEKQQYAVALDCLTVNLASLQNRPFQQQVRLFVIKSLLESVTGDVPSARQSIRHAEQLFWSRAPQRAETWDAPSARVFFSLSLAKQDIERLKFL